MMGPVRAPSADDFRALARSSPWLFTTLHFSHQPADPRRIGQTEAGLPRSAPRRPRRRSTDGPRGGPTLWEEVSDRLQFGDGGVSARGSYPDGWLIGLDRQTGVVVSSEPLCGDATVPGFTNEIHAVDIPMGPALFTARPEPG